MRNLRFKLSEGIKQADKEAKAKEVLRGDNPHAIREGLYRWAIVSEGAAEWQTLAQVQQPVLERFGILLSEAQIVRIVHNFKESAADCRGKKVYEKLMELINSDPDTIFAGLDNLLSLRPQFCLSETQQYLKELDEFLHTAKGRIFYNMFLFRLLKKENISAAPAPKPEKDRTALSGFLCLPGLGIVGLVIAGILKLISVVVVVMMVRQNDEPMEAVAVREIETGVVESNSRGRFRSGAKEELLEQIKALLGGVLYPGESFRGELRERDCLIEVYGKYIPQDNIISLDGLSREEMEQINKKLPSVSRKSPKPYLMARLTYKDKPAGYLVLYPTPKGISLIVSKMKYGLAKHCSWEVFEELEKIILTIRPSKQEKGFNTKSFYQLFGYMAGYYFRKNYFKKRESSLAVGNFEPAWIKDNRWRGKISFDIRTGKLSVTSLLSKYGLKILLEKIEDKSLRRALTALFASSRRNILDAFAETLDELKQKDNHSLLKERILQDILTSLGYIVGRIHISYRFYTDYKDFLAVDIKDKYKELFVASGNHLDAFVKLMEELGRYTEALKKLIYKSSYRLLNAGNLQWVLKDLGYSIGRISLHYQLYIHYQKPNINIKLEFAKYLKQSKGYLDAFIKLMRRLKRNGDCALLKAANVDNMLRGFGFPTHYISTYYKLYTDYLPQVDINKRWEELLIASRGDLDAFITLMAELLRVRYKKLLKQDIEVELYTPEGKINVDAFIKFMDRLRKEYPLLNETNLQGVLRGFGYSLGHIDAHYKLYIHYKRLNIDIKERFAKLSESKSYLYAFMALTEELRRRDNYRLLNPRNLEGVLVGFGYPVNYIGLHYKLYVHYQKLNINIKLEFERHLKHSESYLGAFMKLMRIRGLKGKESIVAGILKYFGYPVEFISSQYKLYNYWLQHGVDIEKEFKELYYKRGIRGAKEIIGNIVAKLIAKRIGLPKGKFTLSISDYVYFVLISLGKIDKPSKEIRLDDLSQMQLRRIARADQPAISQPARKANINLVLATLEEILTSRQWRILRTASEFDVDGPREVDYILRLKPGESEAVLVQVREILLRINPFGLEDLYAVCGIRFPVVSVPQASAVPSSDSGSRSAPWEASRLPDTSADITGNFVCGPEKGLERIIKHAVFDRVKINGVRFMIDRQLLDTGILSDGALAAVMETVKSRTRQGASISGFIQLVAVDKVPCRQPYRISALSNQTVIILKSLVQIKESIIRDILVKVSLYHEFSHIMNRDFSPAFEDAQNQRDVDYTLRLLSQLGNNGTDRLHWFLSQLEEIGFMDSDYLRVLSRTAPAAPAPDVKKEGTALFGFLFLPGLGVIGMVIAAIISLISGAMPLLIGQVKDGNNTPAPSVIPRGFILEAKERIYEYYDIGRGYKVLFCDNQFRVYKGLSYREARDSDNKVAYGSVYPPDQKQTTLKFRLMEEFLDKHQEYDAKYILTKMLELLHDKFGSEEFRITNEQIEADWLTRNQSPAYSSMRTLVFYMRKFYARLEDEGSIKQRLGSEYDRIMRIIYKESEERLTREDVRLLHPALIINWQEAQKRNAAPAPPINQEAEADKAGLDWDIYKKYLAR